MAKFLDFILDDLGYDGIYWDEFCGGFRVRYCYNMWDGCSADIDPKTFQIQKIKGALTLLSRDFRAYQVKRILEQGRPLIVNMMPYTRTLQQLKFAAFTETGAWSDCDRALLYSPIALGASHTERNERDAYSSMLKAMDRGCLYAWFSPALVATHKTLTEYMYPFTPVELHSGALIGQERILTDRSGLFGWGDGSDFEAHVFDRDGKETGAIKIRRVVREEKGYAEVRIPEGYAVAIVRKASLSSPK